MIWRNTGLSGKKLRGMITRGNLQCKNSVCSNQFALLKQTANGVLQTIDNDKIGDFPE